MPLLEEARHSLKHHHGATSTHQPATNPTTKAALDQRRRWGRDRGSTSHLPSKPVARHCHGHRQLQPRLAAGSPGRTATDTGSCSHGRPAPVSHSRLAAATASHGRPAAATASHRRLPPWPPRPQQANHGHEQLRPRPAAAGHDHHRRRAGHSRLPAPATDAAAGPRRPQPSPAPSALATAAVVATLTTHRGAPPSRGHRIRPGQRQIRGQTPPQPRRAAAPTKHLQRTRRPRTPTSHWREGGEPRRLRPHEPHELLAVRSGGGAAREVAGGGGRLGFGGHLRRERHLTGRV
nr:unnamed protein product [Digitaria exilis]CAB3504084.1 unnamed protein product [Digitaria exilis]